MDVEAENTGNLTTFWLIFNAMLRKVSGNDTYMFNPTGFISDEHHATFRAIVAAFGDDAKQRIRTCEFHYKQSVQRHARYLDAADAEEFKRLAEQMLMAPSPSEHQRACAEACAFCADHEPVHALFDWWYERIHHVCRAYKPVDAPHSNLAEVGHSQISDWHNAHIAAGCGQGRRDFCTTAEHAGGEVC